MLAALARKRNCRKSCACNLGKDAFVAREERVGGDDGSAGGDVVVSGELLREAAHVCVARKTWNRR